MISTLNRAHLKKQKQNTYSHTQELMQEVHTHIHMNSCKKQSHQISQGVGVLVGVLVGIYSARAFAPPAMPDSLYTNFTFAIHGPIRCGWGRSSLQARPGRRAFCTDSTFRFLRSPSPLLPFHMHLALVQPLYRASGSSKFEQISIHGPIRCGLGRSSLLARPGRCAFCTDSTFTLSSPSP